MSTEIIKLNSIKNNLQSLFNNLRNKFQSSKNYDITLVIQESTQQEKLSIGEIDQENGVRSSKPSVSFCDNAVIFNDEHNQAFPSMSDNISHENVCQSQQNIPPSKIPKSSTSIKIKRNIHNSDKQNNAQRLKHQTISNYTQTEQTEHHIQDRIINTEIRIEDAMQDEIGKEISVKINDLQFGSQATQTEQSEEDNDSNAGFLIEKHLNQALKFIEEHNTNDLQNFLYDYKEKYSFINLRTQTKWNFLMAHCKLERQQFQRAATNYQQVVGNLKQYPRILNIDLGHIYNKLGRCYYQIKQWNKGVVAYTQALNIYKRNKKVSQYANTIVSLGMLYLQVNYFIEAEKCFLVAYNIKRHQGQKSSRTNLLPILFNLLECNINIKNYKQANQLLNLINQIILQADNVENSYVILYNIKLAKVCYFTGQMELTNKHCQKALELLLRANSQSKQYGQVLEMMGLLRQENGQYAKSREYFDRALKAIEKHLSTDNTKIQILRKRIDALSKFTHMANNHMRMRQDSIRNLDSAESGYSDCFEPDIYQH